eukprot:gene12812-15035_t
MTNNIGGLGKYVQSDDREFSSDKRSSISVWRASGRMNVEKQKEDYEITKFEANLYNIYPSDYADKIKDEQKDMLAMIKRSFEWSATLADIKGIEATLTNLKTYLMLKYPLHRTDYEYFISRLFDIIFEFQLASYDTNVANLLIVLLKDILNMLIRVSKPFFAVGSFQEIQDEVHDWFCPHSNNIFMALIIDLSIGNPKFAHLKPVKHTIPGNIRLIQREENVEYTNMGDMMVHLLTNNPPVAMALLKNLFSSIATYFHPSNQGDWTASLLELITSVCHTFSKKHFRKGKSHVFALMEIALQSLDPIYPNKSSAAFKFYNRIFSCILLNDETVYMTDDDTETELSEADRQATMSTSSFLDWSLVFLDNTLNYIKNASTKIESSEKKRATPPGIFLNDTIDLFFCQMSDEIYDNIIEKLVLFFSKSFEPDYYKQLSIFLKSATMRNPTKSLATFLPVFINKLFKYNVGGDGKYHIKDMSDEEYRWYVSLIGYTVTKCGPALLEHKDTLIRVCSALMETDNKVIVKATSKIVRKALYSLTRYYPANNRSIPSKYFDANENHTKYWGCTDKRIYPVEWIQPIMCVLRPAHGRVTIEAYQGIQTRIYQTLSKILVFIESAKSEEVLILKSLAKSFAALQFGVKDIQNKTSESLFAKWKNLKGVKTRHTITFKAAKAHLFRQKISFERMSMTPCCRNVINDLLRLSMHRYSEVRRLGQECLNIVNNHHTNAIGYCVTNIVDTFIKQRSDEEIKGCIYLFHKKSIYKKLKKTWKPFCLMAGTLLGPLDPKFKPSTRELFNTFKSKIIVSKYDPIVYNRQSLAMKSIDTYDSKEVPKDLVVKMMASIEKENQENMQLLKTLVEKILECFKIHDKKDNLTWKEHIFLMTTLVHMDSLFFNVAHKISLDANNDMTPIIQNIGILRDSLYYTFKNMVNDYPVTRILTINLISQIFYPPQPDIYKEITYGNDVLQHHVLPFIAPMVMTVLDDAFLDKLLKFISQDHDPEGQSHAVASQISAKNVNLNWPNSRHSVSSNRFKIPNAKLFHAFMVLGGDSFFDRIKTRIDELVKKTDKEDQFLLTEIVAGVARFVSTNPDSPRTNEILQYLGNIMFNQLNNCSNELNESWSVCIRFIAHNTKVDRLQWLTDTLFKLYNNPLNIFSQSKSIRFLKALLFEVTYKSPQFLDKLLIISQKEFSDPYKQVRDENYKLFVHVLVYQTQYQTEKGIIKLSPPRLPALSTKCISDIITESTNMEKSVEDRNIVKETLIAMIEHAFSKGFSKSLIRLTPTLLPVIMSFASDANQDIAKASMVCVASMAQGFYFDNEIISQILEKLKDVSTSTFWRVRLSILPFTQILFFNHSFFFNDEQVEAIYSLILTLIKDPQIEVRELAKDTLASVLVSSKSDSNRIQSLIKYAIKGLSNEKITSENAKQKHQYILILSSIILSSPYYIPSYFPEVLEVLSKYSGSIPPIRSSMSTGTDAHTPFHKMLNLKMLPSLDDLYSEFYHLLEMDKCQTLAQEMKTFLVQKNQKELRDAKMASHLDHHHQREELEAIEFVDNRERIETIVRKICGFLQKEANMVLVELILMSIGLPKSLDCLKHTLDIEHGGGIYIKLKDGEITCDANADSMVVAAATVAKRRKTPGGIFFKLAMEIIPPDQKRKVFSESVLLRYKRERRRKGKGHYTRITQFMPLPSVEVLRNNDVPEDFDEEFEKLLQISSSSSSSSQQSDDSNMD